MGKFVPILIGALGAYVLIRFSSKKPEMSNTKVTAQPVMPPIPTNRLETYLKELVQNKLPYKA